MVKKFCTQCGNELDEDDVFCPNCGNNIGSDLPKTQTKPKFNRNHIIIGIITIVILASIVSFIMITSYKEVDSNYVFAPMPNEKVKFTGTYLGPHDSLFNFDNKSGVIQVGNSYAIVSTAKLQGLEGQTVTVKGYFVNDKAETQTVSINNEYVSGEIFCIEEVV